ncbi:MAG TPA: sulfatase [Phycisphaerae bacterium]|nr:sulfatase [Phycisphaerae bacterium]
MLSRRRFMKSVGLGAAALAASRLTPTFGASPRKRTNVLLITADDLNCDSVGVFGCRTPEITPNIDRLAGQGMRFTRAHITIAVCQPCRSVLMTGRYPHRSGGEGFHRITKTDTPLLVERLAADGYRCGILGKVGHCTPKASFQWDMSQDMPQLGMGRNPGLYHQFAKGFMEESAKAGRPFFLMANSHDPHRPFSGSDQEGARFRSADVTPPSRTYRPDEVRTPGFLADLPDVRREIAEYYSSVRRCDDTVGAVLKALDDAGHADDTLVVFLSDHGMPLPFAKTNCYLHSTHTPWMVRWPGVVKPGGTDGEHFISGIDLMPTILDALGLAPPEGMDGFSFLPLLRGEKQGGRTLVFTQFHQTSGRNRYPMRCVQNARFGYIFNPWSDGKRIFRNESQSGRTMKAMQEAAKSSEDIRARVDLFLLRTVEEFYDFEKDPDALKNLAGDPKVKKDLDALRSELEQWMVRTADPALEAFRHRADPQALAKFMADEDARARPVGGAKKGRKKQT